MIYSDKYLSQKLERTEARSNAAFVETRAAILPESNACWIEVAGAYAMFDGIASALTQTFGLGLFDGVSEVELAQIEDFFTDRGAMVCHEVSPLAESSLMPLLNKRGYKPIELSSVMFQPIDNKIRPNSPKNPVLNTRIIGFGEEEMWAKTSAQGWATATEALSDIIFELGMISTQCPTSFPFIAELNGQPISTGLLFIFDDIALFAGTSTILQHRGQGAQLALLDARLQFAANHGCKIAMMCANAGSQSQRNAEKHGFRIAYTRTKWQMFSSKEKI
jgi:hypothetical protein